MIAFSIIIPHRNIPLLLERCLSSIPERSDIQVIVVDDNSSSSIVDFANFPGMGRPNVELHFDKTGKGAGRARNIGISYAKGKWVLFADADDFFTEHAFKILDKYVNCEEDIIFFRADSVESDTLVPVKSRTDYANKYISLGKLPLLRFCHDVPWSKMIKRKLIDDHAIRFEEIEVSNDGFFSACIGIRANEVLAANESIYISTVRKNSLYYGESEDRLKIRYAAALRRNRLLLDNKKGRYKPNLILKANNIRRYSNELYLSFIGRAIKSEGLYWFAVDLAKIIYHYFKSLIR